MYARTIKEINTVIENKLFVDREGYAFAISRRLFQNRSSSTSLLFKTE